MRTSNERPSNERYLTPRLRLCLTVSASITLGVILADFVIFNSPYWHVSAPPLVVSKQCSKVNLPLAPAVEGLYSRNRLPKVGEPQRIVYYTSCHKTWNKQREAFDASTSTDVYLIYSLDQMRKLHIPISDKAAQVEGATLDSLLDAKSRSHIEKKAKKLGGQTTYYLMAANNAETPDSSTQV